MKMQPVWKDANGVAWPVAMGCKLHFAYPSHAALRAFVYARDGYQCRACGARVANPPGDYDGRENLYTDRQYANKATRRFGPRPASLVIDHVVARCNGGTNHPDNLQALCDCCNCSKGAVADKKARAA